MSFFFKVMVPLLSVLQHLDLFIASIIGFIFSRSCIRKCQVDKMSIVLNIYYRSLQDIGTVPISYTMITSVTNPTIAIFTLA